jgi:subfamily B ATP-binding cassette protein MsbA
MRDYLRLLAFLRPYRRRTALLVICVVLASSLASVGITFISPLLRIMFEEDPARVTEVQSPPSPGGAAGQPSGVAAAAPRSGIPLPESVERVRATASQWLHQRLYHGTKMEMLTRLCSWMLLLYFLKNLFDFAEAALLADLEHRAIRDIRARLYLAIQALPLGFFSKERTGYLMSRVVVDVDMMRGAIVGGATRIVSQTIMVLLAVTIVLLVSWPLALSTLLIVPPNVLLVAAISRKLRKGSHRAQEEMGQLAAVLQETISGVRIVKAFGAEAAEARRFDGRNQRYFRAFVKLKVVEALSSPVSEVLGVATAVVIVGFGGQLVLQQRLRPDLLFMFLGVMLWVIAPIKNLIKVNSTLQQSLAAARRVFEVLDTPKESEGGETRTDVCDLREALRFERVGFAYRAGEPVLRDIDLTVRRGEAVALVGASGAGKSTLVDLIPRFYTPTLGRITIDGVDVQDIPLSNLRRMIGMVTQEVILFHDSVEANITYGSPDASAERIEQAARAANAHEFIAAMPHGYQSVVGERGTQLSGGQRQRVAIARAILKDPPILIFDEATSSLDSESERAVQEAMERLMRGRTTLVIAHRLSTVTRCDRIVVLDRGRIVETGTHEELLRRGGAYRRLHDLQFATEPADAAHPRPDPELAR